jgi:outer membrane immunogenic protein
MRRLLMASIAAVGLATSIGASAFAADLPVYTKALPIAPYYSWTGFYAGADVGYAWKDPTVTFSPNDPASALLLGGFAGSPPMGPLSFDDHGVFGGGDIGYNWQFNRSWLVGVETDFNVSSIEGQGSAAAFTPSDFNNLRQTAVAQISADQEILWFGTVRARAGWLATNDLLLYGTGGFAYGKVSEAVSLTTSLGTNQNKGGFSYSCAANIPCFLGTSDRIATGWTAGAGAEYHVPGTNASFKVEYLYVNLGAGDTVNAVAQNFNPALLPSSFAAKYSTTDFNTVKLGLNWKF